MCPSQVKQLKWYKTSSGFIKINFDAAWESNKAEVGFVACNTEGFVYGGGIFFMQDVVSAEWAEVEGLIKSHEWAKRENMLKIIIEGDCAVLINRVSKMREDITTIGFMLRQCRELIKEFADCCVIWCPCTCNRVADSLSKIGLAKICNLFFYLDFPSEVQNLVISYSC